MNTEELTSFFRIINNSNNQKGGSILESIETKKFSMYGGEEKIKEESFDQKINLIIEKMSELKERHNQLKKDSETQNKDNDTVRSKLQSEYDEKVSQLEEGAKKLEELISSKEEIESINKKLKEDKQKLTDDLDKERKAIEKGRKEFLQATAEIADVKTFFDTVNQKVEDKAEVIKKESEKANDTKVKSDPFKKEEPANIMRGGDVIDEILNFSETF